MESNQALDLPPGGGTAGNRVSAATPEDLAAFTSLRERHCPAGHFIGEGVRVVRRMLEAGCVAQVLCSEEWVERLPAAGVEVRVAPRESVDRVAGLRIHQRVMALGRIPEPGPVRGSLLVALDGISSAENVGSILRTCAAFGVEGVLVGPGTASPWHRRAVRVSLAAGLRVPVHFPFDLAAVLAVLPAYAAHLYGDLREYTQVDFTQPCCLVFGGEANGPSERVLAACRLAIHIPMAPGWDCLNVAASAAVLLAEARRQRAPPPS
ncbi:MAG: RNA methyltransferase [Planctomycetes bacterium]|nr:RNA methyltransferase [Planctomycetota bacterium]